MRKILNFIIVLSLMFLFGYIAVSKELDYEKNQPVVNNFLKNISIDKPISYKNMTIYPIISKYQLKDNLLLLDDSLENKVIEITEKGSGQVNNLELQKNHSKNPVFIMAGEIIKGAKQDRIISNDLILGKDEKKYTISVYCVEQGRWVNKTDRFESSQLIGANALRSAVVQKKAQSEVWKEVAKKNDNLQAGSSTSNYRASYESKRYQENSSGYLDHFLSLSKKNPNYIGVIVKIDNKISNVDLFGNHNTFSSLWPKTLKAYAQDAVDTDYLSGLKDTVSVNNIFDSIKKSTFQEVSNPGLGNEYSIKSNSFYGNVLIYSNNVIHLALFVDQNEDIKPTKIDSYDQIPELKRHKR